MQSDWILEVLTDLKAFATINGLPVLAEQLDDTAIVALAEISALEERNGRKSNGSDLFKAGSDIGGVGAGHHI
ncbi:hypothetical protein [Sulfitobacter marinus]|uniref:hypothetical protein n=1 Tax=Sulfitobacter marinus TaxID=394264 RepID=UPI001113316E|nr:hypothetical protein [Sulfitobacter marinus]